MTNPINTTNWKEVFLEELKAYDQENLNEAIACKL
jgi:hypothetical protein